MTPPSTVLVVDDEPLNLAVMSRLLNPHWRVLGARSGQAALSLLAQGHRPDLILLDVMMPELDGHEVLRRLRADPASRDIPVIFVTALGDEENEELGLALGAVDYIVKPVKPAVVLARVRTHLALAQAQAQLSDQNAWLEAELARRVRESLLAQDLTLCAMAELAETRDSDTGNHILRTQSYVEALGRCLQRDPAHAAELDAAQLARIVKAAPMHDIGKIGIPDHILLKPGRLTEAEFEVMKTHARIGGEAIARAMKKAMAMHGQDPAGGLADDGDGQGGAEALRFLGVARTIAMHHHERWDGLGYPDGLAGHDIPLPARLMALADVWDALTTRRIYKDAWSADDAMRYLQHQSGLQFDPALVSALLGIRGEFEAIMQRLRD
ncbi:MAG: response regulator [Burkholderiaceae bacterium]|nr:response regulator [Burkholderiaceae bacterium]